MIDVKNLTITTKTGRVILNNISFSLNKGDKFAIIGEEGNGKTTLLKAIYNTKQLNDDFFVNGNIFKNEVIGYLEQFLNRDWNRQTVIDFLFKKTPDSEMDYERYEKYNEYVIIANSLGLKKDILDSNQLIKSFSGGEKVKLQLLKILIDKPDFLLLDEPTNDLDIDTLEWLESFIKQSDCGILFVSHDETLLENTANGILHLEQIKRKTEARWSFTRENYSEYIANRKHNLDKQDQVAKDEHDQRKMAQKTTAEIKSRIQSANPGRTNSMRAVLAREKRWEREQLTEFSDVEEAIKININEKLSILSKKIVLDLNLKKLEVEKQLLARNINLKVVGPEKVGIIGKNGVGKTTLLKIIDEKIQQGVGLYPIYMPQNYEEYLDVKKSPLEIISQNKNKDEITLARTVLGRLNFTEEEVITPIKNLSGGQKAKLFLANIALSNNSNVLLLDEPTRNLSPLTNPVIRSLFKKYNGAIISISHDRKFLAEVCQTIYELTEDGLNKKNIIR